MGIKKTDTSCSLQFHSLSRLDLSKIFDNLDERSEASFLQPYLGLHFLQEETIKAFKRLYI